LGLGHELVLHGLVALALTVEEHGGHHHDEELVVHPHEGSELNGHLGLGAAPVEWVWLNAAVGAQQPIDGDPASVFIEPEVGVAPWERLWIFLTPELPIAGPERFSWSVHLRLLAAL
jgi:hypothetical protein